MTAPHDPIAPQPAGPPEAGGQGKQGYDPEGVEARWYRAWEEQNLFHADETSTASPYCIVIPPPNVTGSLHMGHALNNTLQDILVRWHRMAGTTPSGCPGRITPESPRRTWWSGSSGRRDTRGTSLAARRSWSASGSGSASRAGPSSASSRRWALLRLGPRAVHHGPRPVGGGEGGLLPALREGADLPRELHHQLVPALPDGALGSGGGAPGAGRQALAHPLSARGRHGRRGGGDDAAGDHAGRHGGGGPPRGRAFTELQGRKVLLPVMDREIPSSPIRTWTASSGPAWSR